MSVGKSLEKFPNARKEGQINFKCHKSYMVKLRGASSCSTTNFHTFYLS